MNYSSLVKFMLMEFTPDFRKARELANMTQQQVADAIGISVRQYIKYENLEVAPKFTTWQRIIKVLGENMNDSSSKQVFLEIAELDPASLEKFRNEMRDLLNEKNLVDVSQHGTSISGKVDFRVQDKNSFFFFAQAFKKFIENENFRLFEFKHDDELEPKLFYLGERLLNINPFDYFPYVFILDDDKLIFAYIKKIDKERWGILGFKNKTLEFIDAKSVKEIWIIRKVFVSHEYEPEIFEVDKSKDKVGNLESSS